MTTRTFTADDLRNQGWTVAVHNDYRLHGEAHTFWMFTKGDRALKGEGRTDQEALAQIVAQIDAPGEVPVGTGQSAEPGIEDLAAQLRDRLSTDLHFLYKDTAFFERLVLAAKDDSAPWARAREILNEFKQKRWIRSILRTAAWLRSEAAVADPEKEPSHLGFIEPELRHRLTGDRNFLYHDPEFLERLVLAAKLHGAPWARCREILNEYKQRHWIRTILKTAADAGSDRALWSYVHDEDPSAPQQLPSDVFMHFCKMMLTPGNPLSDLVQEHTEAVRAEEAQEPVTMPREGAIPFPRSPGDSYCSSIGTLRSLDIAYRLVRRDVPRQWRTDAQTFFGQCIDDAEREMMFHDRAHPAASATTTSPDDDDDFCSYPLHNGVHNHDGPCRRWSKKEGAAHTIALATRQAQRQIADFIVGQTEDLNARSTALIAGIAYRIRNGEATGVHSDPPRVEISVMSTTVDDEQCDGWTLRVDGSWQEDPREPGDDTVVARIFDQDGKVSVALESVCDLGSVSIDCPVAVLRKIIDRKDPDRA